MAKIKKTAAVILSLVVLVTTLCFGSSTAYAKPKKPTAPKLSSYCNLTSNPVLTWNKISGVTGYRVYRSEKKNGKFTWIATVKKGTSYTDKKAAKKKTYYYNVRAFKTDKSGTVRSAASNTVKQKALKTVLVGDSIMYGVEYYKGLPGGDFITKIGVGPNSFYNYAYSDYLIDGKASKGVDKVISTNADRVFIMLGMNEIDWNSTSSTISNYRKCLEKMKKNMPNAKIIVLATSPTGSNRASGVPSLSKVNSYNREVKKLCSDLKLSYFDYTASFKNANGYLKSEFNGGDGCHWNKSGVDQFVKELNGYVKTH